MVSPIYIEGFCESTPEVVAEIIHGTPWIDRTEARRECFMSEGGGISYTYGKGRGIRTYTSGDYTEFVRGVLAKVNSEVERRGWLPMNGCFLNCYTNEGQHLGWHADDFVKMDHSCPVVVVSFGEEREIWWRPLGDKGVVPAGQRQSLASGSMFIMLPGMQHTHEHRIPKGDHSMGERVSLTFRRFL